MLEANQRKTLGDMLTFGLLSLMVYFMAMDYYGRTQDRWHKQDMIEWSKKLQRENANVRVVQSHQHLRVSGGGLYRKVGYSHHAYASSR